MKILPISDIHREIWRAEAFWDLPSMKDVVLVLAGDVFNFRRDFTNEITHLLSNFKAVVYTPGNHEFYGLHPDVVNEALAEIKLKYGPSGFHVLDRNTCTIDGQRFIGCTLWVPKPDINTPDITDTILIKGFKPWVFREHNRCIEYLNTNVCNTDIVVTHHAPSTKSIHQKYAGNDVNPWFVANDAEGIIVTRQPKLWVHGHMHDSFDYTIDTTRVLCNPIGYPHEGQDTKANLVPFEI